MKTNLLKNESGFTLVELILTIAILGLLAAALTPSFGNLLASSQDTGGKGTAGAIQSAINTKYAENVANNTTPFYPTTLDTVPSGSVCEGTTPCFEGVAQPITNGQWHKSSDTVYQYVTSSVTQTYTYDTVSGLFACSAGC